MTGKRRRYISMALVALLFVMSLPQAALAITLPGALPVANPDAYSTTSDAASPPLVANAPGVLANDSGSGLTAIKVTDPAHGTLLLNANGSFTYTPATGFSGTDSFTYKAHDPNGDSPPATVSLLVSHVNIAPSFTKGSDQTVLEDSGAQSVTGWATAISPGAGESGQSVHFNVTNNTNAALFSSAPAVSPTGTLTYTPAANANGTATVTLTLQDDGGTGGGGQDTSPPQSFVITVTAVNDAPSFTKGADQTVFENAGAQTVNPWATAISPGPPDESGQTIHFNVTNNTNTALFSAGPAVSATGTLTYTPAANQFGTATITLVAQDSGGVANGGVDTSPSQTFVITVGLVNHAPSFTKGADQTVLEDAGAQSVTGWATAISPGPPNESTQTVHFNVTNNTNAALFSAAPAISPTGTLTYTPAANANGTATITLVAQDDGGVANGGVDTSPAQTFVITVTAVNDAPSFTKGVDQNVLENAGPQTIAGWATAISPGPPDESAQTVHFNVTNNTNAALFSAGPAISPTGALTYTPAANANGTATITITLQDNGGVANGGADTSAPQTFTITVSNVNQPPSFTKGSDQTVLEDAGAQSVPNWATAISPGPPNESTQTVQFNMTNNTNPGLFSAGPAISPTGTLTYTPAKDANGTATITLVAQDNGGTANGGQDTSASQTFVINVTAVNDAPSFTKGADQTVLEDSGAQTVNGWATAISPGPPDESGQTVQFIVIGNTNAALFSAGPAISPTGTLTYTPAANANGTATITIFMQDNGGTANGGVAASAPQTFVITVTAVNDAPTFTKGADVTVLESSGGHTVTPWATAISPGPADESGQIVHFNVTGNTNAALFAAGPGVAANGDLSFTLAAGVSGTATITLVAQDDGGTANGGVDTSAPQSFVITVTQNNQPPSFTRGTDQTVLEDSGTLTVSPWATAISQGTGDSGQTVHFNVTGNTNAALFSAGPTISPTGDLSFTPAPNANGLAIITITLQDDGGTANGGVDTSPPQTFRLTVIAVNDAPSFTKGPDQTVLENAGAQTVSPWATAISPGPPDEVGQTVQFNVTGNTNAALFSAGPAISATGTLTYTPAANANGSATITITLSDNGGTANGGADTSPPQTFVITVTSVNQPPSFTKGADQTVLEDSGPQSVTGWATAISPGPPSESGQTVQFNVTGNTNAALFSAGPAISATGTLTYTPAANANGSATITITLSDNGGTANGGVDTSAPQTFVITVTAVNDAPSFTKGPDQLVIQDSGAHTVSPWATAISAGPPDESGQTLTFNVTGNTNPSLFSAGPAISSTGALTFTSAPGAFGTATITITLSDNGGVANGGIDTSAPQTFVITVDDPPTVSTTVPTNGATGVAPSTTITINFSKSVNVTGSAFTLECPTPTPVAFTVTPASPASSYVLHPSANLPGGVICTVTVIANQVADVSASANMVANYLFSFTVDPPPTVSSVVPANGAIDVALNATITVNFSEPVNVTGSAFTLQCPTPTAIPFTVTPASPASSFVLHPTANLPGGAICTVTVVATQVTDVDQGQQMAAGFTSSFTVDTPPTVTTTTPANGATGIVQSATVTINFSKAVTVTGSAFTLECPTGTPVTFTVTPASPASSFVLHPSPSLPAGVICTVVVSASQVTDAVGTAMATDYTFTFDVPPVAVNDAYPETITGNVSVNSALISYSVTSNDISAAPFTITAFDATSAHGGTVTITTSGAGMGQLTYNPPAGYTGSDSFTYTIANAAGSTTGTVSFTISGIIWFINNGASAGDGRLSSPLNSLASFQAINDGAPGDPAANANIFLYESGTNYTGPVTLLSGQKLIGQDATATLATITGLTPGTSSAALPAMNSGNATIVRVTSSGNTVTLGSNNTVRGLTLGNATGLALTGTSFGTLAIRDLTITTTGAALSLTTGALDAIVTAVSSGGGTHGIALTSTTGSLEVTGDGASDPANTTHGRTTAKNGGGTLTLGSGGTIAGATSAGVLLSNATNVTLRNMTIQNNGSGINTGGDGITLSGSTSGLTLDNVKITGHTGNYGLHGTTVSNVTIAHTEISGNATSAGVETPHVWNVRFDDLSGASNAITNSLFFNSRENIIGFQQGAINGTVTATVTMSNSEVRDTATASPGNDGISVNLLNSANLSLSVTSSLFLRNRSSAIQYTGNNSSGGGTITVTNSTFDQSSASEVNISHQGLGKTVDFTISNNSMRQTVGGGGNAINIFLAGLSNASTQLRGKIQNNLIGNQAVPDSGASTGQGINLFASGAGTLTALVDGNTVRQIHQDSAFQAISSNHAGQLNVTVTNNDFQVSQTSGLGIYGIDLTVGGGGAGDTGTMCANLNSNIAAIADPTLWGINAQSLAAGSTLNLQGYGGAANNAAQIAAFLNTRATTVSPPAQAFPIAGTIKAAPSACATPP